MNALLISESLVKQEPGEQILRDSTRYRWLSWALTQVGRIWARISPWWWGWYIYIYPAVQVTDLSTRCCCRLPPQLRCKLLTQAHILGLVDLAAEFGSQFGGNLNRPIDAQLVCLGLDSYRSYLCVELVFLHRSVQKWYFCHLRYLTILLLELFLWNVAGIAPTAYLNVWTRPIWMFEQGLFSTELTN